MPENLPEQPRGLEPALPTTIPTERGSEIFSWKKIALATAGGAILFGSLGLLILGNEHAFLPIFIVTGAALGAIHSHAMQANTEGRKFF